MASDLVSGRLGARPSLGFVENEIFDPAVRRFVPRMPDEPVRGLLPRRPVSLALLSTLFAMLVAIYMWFVLDFTLFETKTLFIGRNIDHALGVVFFGGLAGTVLIPFVRKRRPLFVSALLLEAAALCAAIVLVALDGAIYKEKVTETLFFGPGNPTSTSTDHLWFLYLLWGLPLVVLLVQIARPGLKPIVRAELTKESPDADA